MTIINDVSALWNRAQKAVFMVLRDQDSAGLWKTLQGSFSSGDKTQWRWHSQVDNIGLHTFVVERLLRDWSHLPPVRTSVIRGLRAILHDGVEIEGRLMWRWLKVPTRTDYLYPPDYDDTARAIAALQLGEQLLTKDEFGQVISGFETRGLRSDLAQAAARDLCELDEELRPSHSEQINLRAVCTFFGGLAVKADNTADPVVNANLLYALTVNEGQRITEVIDPLVEEITKYLLEVVRRKNNLFPQFREFSHYYLTPCLFGYLCAQLQKVAPTLISNVTMRSLAKGLVQYASEQQLTAEEAAWAMVVFEAAGTPNFQLAERLASRILGAVDSAGSVIDPSPIYQHKRLVDVFGSRSYSTLICLEGLRSFLSVTSTTQMNQANRQSSIHVSNSASHTTG